MAHRAKAAAKATPATRGSLATELPAKFLAAPKLKIVVQIAPAMLVWFVMVLVRILAVPMGRLAAPLEMRAMVVLPARIKNARRVEPRTAPAAVATPATVASLAIPAPPLAKLAARRPKPAAARCVIVDSLAVATRHVNHAERFRPLAAAGPCVTAVFAAVPVPCVKIAAQLVWPAVTARCVAMDPIAKVAYVDRLADAPINLAVNRRRTRAVRRP